jgi:hypothetical protein
MNAEKAEESRGTRRWGLEKKTKKCGNTPRKRTKELGSDREPVGITIADSSSTFSSSPFSSPSSSDSL